VSELEADELALFRKHCAEVDNGIWPTRDCPICEWIMNRPTIEKRYLAQPVRHSDLIDADIAA
jgi:hypothetical protein